MELTILCGDLLSQNGKTWKNTPVDVCYLFASSLALPATPHSAPLSFPHCALIISVFLFFPHFPLSRSLTLLSTSHFSFPEMRGCIHGNKAEVGAGGRGGGGCELGSSALYGW